MLVSADVSTINLLAIVAGGIGAWIMGAIWYGVLGKQWMAALGKSKDELKMGAAPFVLSFIADIIMAAVLAIVLHIFAGGAETIRSGLECAALLWLGFVLTTISVNNAYAGRKPMLTIIDSGHWLVAALVAGAIIGAFG